MTLLPYLFCSSYKEISIPDILFTLSMSISGKYFPKHQGYNFLFRQNSFNTLKISNVVKKVISLSKNSYILSRKVTLHNRHSFSQFKRNIFLWNSRCFVQLSLLTHQLHSQLISYQKLAPLLKTIFPIWNLHYVCVSVFFFKSRYYSVLIYSFSLGIYAITIVLAWLDFLKILLSYLLQL
jgi:hypothetical protein